MPRVWLMAAMVLVLSRPLQGSPPPETPPQPGSSPSEFDPEVIVVPPDARKSEKVAPRATRLRSFQPRLTCMGMAIPAETAGERSFYVGLVQQITDFDRAHWSTRYPDCRVGMLLPVCGCIARIESVGDAIQLRRIAETDLPAGVADPGDGFPLIAGVANESPVRRLHIDRIGIDDSNTLSIDLTETWTLAREQERKTHRETFRGLKVGDAFPVHETECQSDFRVAQIIRPNEKAQVSGWITLRPVPGSFRWREHMIEPLDLPRSITVGHEIRRGNLPPQQPPELPSYRRGIDFGGKTNSGRDAGEWRVSLSIQDRVHDHRKETWGYSSPECAVGMLLPLCGRVGRIESVGEDTEFRMLSDADLPEGVVSPGDSFPLILGGHGEPKLERIGIDDMGILSVDLTQRWDVPLSRISKTWKSETLKQLKVGDTFTRRFDNYLADYRIEQIIKPDEAHHVPGWITVRPIAGTTRWRHDDFDPVALPPTISIPTAPNPPAAGVSLPSFRRDFKFTARLLDLDARGSRTLEITTVNHRDFGRGFLDVEWVTRYPECPAGTLLPLCGGLVRVEQGSQELRFRTLNWDEWPQWMRPPTDDFPVILGGGNESLHLDRITRDPQGGHTVDLTITRSTPGPNNSVKRETESLRGLKRRSEIVLDGLTLPNYQIDEIVPPDEAQHVVGWITLRPVVDSNTIMSLPLQPRPAGNAAGAPVN